jgi:hypothetical protein
MVFRGLQGNAQFLNADVFDYDCSTTTFIVAIASRSCVGTLGEHSAKGCYGQRNDEKNVVNPQLSVLV